MSPPRILARPCTMLYPSPMGNASRSKLFRAIVGLGLAAAGCGGAEVARIVDAGESAKDGASQDANGQADGFAQDDTGLVFFPPAFDAGADAAADVAADVAAEAWHPVPIA
jgi:hypothetical protein